MSVRLSSLSANRFLLLLLLLGSALTPASADTVSGDVQQVAEAIDRDQIVVVSERARRAGGGTKTDTPIAVITAEQMLERGALSVQDVLLYSAGVRSDAYGNDSRVAGQHLGRPDAVLQSGCPAAQPQRQQSDR